jgi:hypothetical protein
VQVCVPNTDVDVSQRGASLIPEFEFVSRIISRQMQDLKIDSFLSGIWMELLWY